MNKNVNVLAVMDAYVTHWSKEVVLTSRNPEINDAARYELAISTQVRAAVAELIEASEAYANGEYHDIEIESRCDYSSRRRKERYRVNAALARVKGA